MAKARVSVFSFIFLPFFKSVGTLILASRSRFHRPAIQVINDAIEDALILFKLDSVAQAQLDDQMR
jgi:hypothetical protein